MRTLRSVPRVTALLLWSGLAVCTALLSAQSGKLAAVGTISGPADLVKVYGTYAYVAAGPIFRIVDVTDPSAPRLTGTFSFRERIWAFTVSGSLAYIAADWSGLGILDVSNPAAPKLRG